MHLLTSSTMKELVSWAFLNNFKNIASRKGSIDFFNASHISAKVIIAFFAKLERKDSTNLRTYGIMVCKF